VTIASIVISIRVVSIVSSIVLMAIVVTISIDFRGVAVAPHFL
jgi:hypothetical protein